MLEGEHLLVRASCPLTIRTPWMRAPEYKHTGTQNVQSSLSSIPGTHRRVEGENQQSSLLTTRTAP